MEIVFKILIKIIPDNWILILNEQSLDEIAIRVPQVFADKLIHLAKKWDGGTNVID
ncbi:MAG: hypothetical protein QNJ36_03100 [Calothrix sp. MO_167.B42]|nr:hypothetical protein [Calothrix sp. MO_167.B42]